MEKNRKRPVLQVYLDRLRCISKEKIQTTLGNTELWFQLGIEDDAGTWLRESCWESGKRENQAARLPVFVWVGRMKKETWMVKILSRIKYHFLVLIAQKIISSLLWPLWQDSRGLVAQSVIPWTVASQAPLPMRFSRQEYWSRLPFPPAGSLPDTVTEPRFSTLEADSLPSEDRRSPINPRLLLLSLLWSLS